MGTSSQFYVVLGSGPYDGKVCADDLIEANPAGKPLGQQRLAGRHQPIPWFQLT